ncbi:MAG: MerR family transcriptional regulator [Atopobiaceae bacterium]|nr:MerR family transcriptional regulator [Atopobiaceae bacterium]
MPDAGYLTIGKVVKKLQERYPDLSVSKVRYLEDEGLLTPSRTPGGYRLYSHNDIKRLETILYLQKNRFMPLSVIKEELDKGEASSTAAGMPSSATVAFANEVDDEETLSKLHPIDRIPELLGVSVTFVKQLSEAGLITLQRSPHGRDLVDGKDFALIRTCEELRRFGIGAKNLRQYVTAANRESAMFEQALVIYARTGEGALERTDEKREQFETAFNEMLVLTNQVRDALITRHIKQSFKGMAD